MPGPAVTITGAGRSFQVQLGPRPIEISDGHGGWQEVSRARRMAVTEWQGPSPLKVKLPVLYDGYSTGASVQGQVTALINGVSPPDGSAEPPPFTITGAWPVPASTQFVCDGIEWDSEGWIRDEAGTPVRALFTIICLQYVAPDPIVRTSTATSRAATSTTAASSTAAPARASTAAAIYTVKAGDTLTGIAAAMLGDWRRFTDLASLNGIRDPNTVPAGATLRIPT